MRVSWVYLNGREEASVARLGGDEFVVVLENLNKQTTETGAQSRVIGEKILASLSQTYLLDTHQYYGTGSIRANVFKGHHLATDDLIKQADIAMYQAKQAGRNTVRSFDENIQNSITNRFSLQ